MGDTENRYTTKDIADMLGVEAVTIRKYALALEKAGYVVPRSDGKNRSYSDRDAMAFKQLQTLRVQTGMTVDLAANVVATKGKAATDAVIYVDHNDEIDEIQRYDGRYDALAAQIAQLMAIQQTAAAALPSPEQERATRLDEHLTQRRIERQLEREALDRWAAKPESERMRRVGLFRKELNVEARDRYVREYVDHHYEQRLRAVYGGEPL